jgi:peptidyl-prolyl cis-trans isomerase D
MFRFFRRYRDAVKKWLLVFFLTLVSVSMVITLAPLPGGNTQMEVNVLADVDGEPVTTQDVQRSIQSRLRNSPLANNPEMVARMASIILEDMILRRALQKEAKKLGIGVTDLELSQDLRTSMPFLYPEGNFVGIERYRDFISQQAGMTVPQFEAQLREGLMLQKMRAVITDGVRVSPDEVRQEFRRRNAKAKIEYVVFDPSRYLQSVEISQGALESFFQKNEERYKAAEQRQVRYVLIDPDRVRAQVKLSEDDLRQYYNQHLSDFRVEDRVKVAHILFKTEGKTPEEIQTLEKTARDVLDKLKSGADFAEMARQYSEDSSASQGGEIGWIVRGQTVKEFEDAAFRMKPGEVSDLIKTSYGFHIIKVFDKQQAHLQTFDEVKGQIREDLSKQKFAEAQQTVADDLERQFKQNPQEFTEIARKAGLEAKETPLFQLNQAIPDMGSSESFHNLAFQLLQGEVGPPITVPKGLVIIQVAEIVPEHLPKLEEVRARVEEDFRVERSKELAVEKARDFATHAKTGDFRALARAAGLAVKESTEFTQQDYVEGLGSGSQLSAAFDLPVGQTSDSVSVGANSAVLRVLSRTPPNEADFPSQRDQIAEELMARKRTLTWEIYRQSLKQRLLSSGQLKMNEAGMKQFLASFEKS